MSRARAPGRQTSPACTSPSRRCRPICAPPSWATSPPTRSTASSTPAARACATSSTIAMASSGGSRTSSSAQPPRTRCRQDHARRPGRRRGAHPVRRRDQHLGQPRGPAKRTAHGHLARHGTSSTGCSPSTRPPASPRIQAGAFGPDLERQLNAQGWTLGHFPDSFTHSTLGGWIATRSSGMQSDRYGDIADLTRAVRVVTPKGLLVTRPGAPRLDRAERAGDGARERGPARGHHRGDRAGAARARPTNHPRLPVPDVGRRPRGHARHRRRARRPPR